MAYLPMNKGGGFDCPLISNGSIDINDDNFIVEATINRNVAWTKTLTKGTWLAFGANNRNDNYINMVFVSISSDGATYTRDSKNRIVIRVTATSSDITFSYDQISKGQTLAVIKLSDEIIN